MKTLYFIVIFLIINLNLVIFVEAAACKVGKYGPKCEHACGNCLSGTTCDPVTGNCVQQHVCQPGYTGPKCVTSCPRGKYGWHCGSICSANCQQPGGCHPETGKCTQGCKTGYLGDTCDQKCNRGFYGAGCEKICRTCINFDCNRENGACLSGCAAGYTGLPNCTTPCTRGTYGVNCTSLCTNCMNNNCSARNGFCLHCEPGWRGLICDSRCTDKTYGSDCTQRCGSCLNKTNCDPKTGACHSGCQRRWFGTTCHQKYPVVLHSPAVVEARVHELKVKINIVRDDLQSEEQQFLELQYWKSGELVWRGLGIKNVTIDKELQIISGLEAGTIYYLRTVLFVDNDTTSGYTGEDVPYTYITTDCVLAGCPNLLLVILSTLVFLGLLICLIIAVVACVKAINKKRKTFALNTSEDISVQYRITESDIHVNFFSRESIPTDNIYERIVEYHYDDIGNVLPVPPPLPEYLVVLRS